MKKLSLLFSTLAIFAANAESMRVTESLEAWTARRLQEAPPHLDEKRPNEIKVGSLSYSGIAIEAVKMDNPFQLINPAAPVQYGYAEANLVRDPVLGRVSGLKIFSIQF
jgi:hypothetical protein